MRTHIAQNSAVLIMIATALLSASAAESINIDVTLDRITYAKVPPDTVTVLVGNTYIADVRLLCQTGDPCSKEERRVVVVTGRGYGVTNLLAFGQDLAQKPVELFVRVRSPDDSVFVYRGSVDKGIERHSYSCAPRCERRITVGDTPDFFNDTINETTRAQQPIAGTTAPPR